MRLRALLFGGLLSACQPPSEAPSTTVADAPVFAPEPEREPTWTIVAPEGRPTELVSARMKAIGHRISGCLADAVDRDPLVSGESVTRLTWSAGEVRPSGRYDGVLEHTMFASCLDLELGSSRSYLEEAGSTQTYDELQFEFTLSFQFSGPFAKVRPLPPESQRGEERWSVLSEADDGTLSQSTSAPTGAPLDALLRCRLPPKTALPSSLGGWLVGRIDRAGKLTLADSLQRTNDSDCLRRALSRATFPAGPSRYFRVQTVPDLSLARSAFEAHQSEMARMDAAAVGRPAPKTEAARKRDEPREFGMIALMEGGGPSGGGAALDNTAQGVSFGLGAIGDGPLPSITSTFEVTGGLSIPEVRRAVGRRFDGLRSCYVRALAGQPTLAFTSKTRLPIDPQGAVFGPTSKVVSAAGPARPGPEFFSDCLHRVLGTLRFAAPDGGSAIAVITLSFAPLTEGSYPGGAPTGQRRGLAGQPFGDVVLDEAFAEAAPLENSSRLTGLWFVKGTRDQDSPIVAILRGPESQAKAQTDCHVRDSGIELRFFARDPANAASACKDFAAKHVRPID